MSTHTPGTLIIDQTHTGIRLISHRGAVAEMLAGYGQTRLDDAAFIVRACNAHEEILEALKAMVAEWNRHGCCDSTDVRYKAEHAIAKAEGRA